MSHHAHVYHSLEEWTGTCFDSTTGTCFDSPKGKRYAAKVWKRHIEKNGNVPLIRKCSICSGKEHRLDIKHGGYNPKRPSKRLRIEAEGVR